MSDSPNPAADTPSRAETIGTWGRIGVLSFGGPAAQIALMHRVVVEEKRWLSERQFLNALNFCMLLPGPEAMQLATYTGWRIHGVAGGLIAGGLFVLPGAVVMLLLSGLYTVYGELGWVQAAFTGIKAAVLVIVVEALFRISRRALNAREYYFIAFLAFIGIFFLAIPYPVIVILAALLGLWFGTGDAGERARDPDIAPRHPFSETLRTVLLWMVLWWAPLGVLVATGAEPILSEIAIFFSKLAVVTFGGAYAVLAYMAQDVVEANAWLSASEMVDGLGLAETTPGPLILVTQFVGFLAAEKTGGLALGLLGAGITLWMTFVPCFLWIFAGAPYIERLSEQPRLRGALMAITSAVVGVVLNLSIWFAMHVLFATLDTRWYGPVKLLVPDLASLNWTAFALALVSAVLLLGLRWNILLVLVVAATGGLIAHSL